MRKPPHTCTVPHSRYCRACFEEGACGHQCQSDDAYQCENLKHKARTGRWPEFPVEPCPCSICHDMGV